jgi:hypothetical protein
VAGRSAREHDRGGVLRPRGRHLAPGRDRARAQYAAAVIALYLVVLLDETYDITEIREFHLDAAALTYRLHAVRRSVLDLEQPVRLTLPIAELVIA